MNRRRARGPLATLGCVVLAGLVGPARVVPADETARGVQYILVNRAPGQGMNQFIPATLGRKQFDEVRARLPNRPGARIQTGVSYVFSCFRTPPETTLAALRTFLDAAEQTGTPVLVQIDTEHWWEARPDLWNWWDATRPGFDSANRSNVEWTGWSPDDALKIAWRNWGHQLRVLPPPNLASPRYTAACREASRCGVPRERLFAHGAGWKPGELIYDVPVNRHACPGWSFYRQAADPRKDVGVQRNLARSDAPYWAATEWLYQGPQETAPWRKALTATLADPKCRYLCIFNWEGIRSSDAVLRAIGETTQGRGEHH